MKLNLTDAVLSCLEQKPDEKLSARQIAQWILSVYPDQCQVKKQNSTTLQTDAQLVQQLAAEISSRRPAWQRRYPCLKTTEGRPLKYYYGGNSGGDELFGDQSEACSTDSSIGASMTLSEQALYPMLVKYLRSVGVYARRINEKRGTNRRGPCGNHWLYPDLVGMEDLGCDWHDTVKQSAKYHGDKRTKLWSFEVKVLINRSNVRECFFQGVSNSSWANFGYLVASEIQGPDTVKELRMLWAAHGIGLIKLDAENPTESQILFPAREKDQVDWDMASRLAHDNHDFRHYMTLVKEFYQTGVAKPTEWCLSL